MSMIRPTSAGLPASRARSSSRFDSRVSNCPNSRAMAESAFRCVFGPVTYPAFRHALTLLSKAGPIRPFVTSRIAFVTPTSLALDCSHRPSSNTRHKSAIASTSGRPGDSKQRRLDRPINERGVTAAASVRCNSKALRSRLGRQACHLPMMRLNSFATSIGTSSERNSQPRDTRNQSRQSWTYRMLKALTRATTSPLVKVPIKFSGTFYVQGFEATHFQQISKWPRPVNLHRPCFSAGR